MQPYEVVVVAYRSAALVTELLRSRPPSQPVVVVDNAHGVDGLAEVVAGSPPARYLDGPGPVYASGANLGARTSAHDYVVFVNPDSSPDADQLDALVATSPPTRSSPRCPPRLLPDGRVELGVGGWEPSLRRALVHAVGAHKLFPPAGLWARPVPGEPHRARLAQRRVHGGARSDVPRSWRLRRALLRLQRGRRVRPRVREAGMRGRSHDLLAAPRRRIGRGKRGCCGCAAPR